MSYIADNTPLSHGGKRSDDEEATGAAEPDKMMLATPSYSQVELDPTCRLSPYASIIGDVAVGPESSVFAGAHIRGDADSIRIGARTNIQENCSLHTSGGSPLAIGDGVTVGHGAIVHGCTIDDNALIGMGSIVMDHAHIGEYSLVGAGALVTEHKEFPPRSLIIGAPARAVRTLSDAEIDELVVKAAAGYVDVTAEMVREGVLTYPDAGERIWSTPAFGQNTGVKLLEQLGLDRTTAMALLRQLMQPSDDAADA